MMEMLNMENDR